MRGTLCCVLMILFTHLWCMAQDDISQQTNVKELIQRTIKVMGGKAFLSWEDYYGKGKIFSVKGDAESWTKFWEYYKWQGKSRVEFDKKHTGIVDIYNLELGKGWSYTYGKIKEKNKADILRFKRGEKRDLTHLFRIRWKEPGMHVYYIGPDSIDSIIPMEALEFVDNENYTVTVYFDQGEPLPKKVSFKERMPNGIVVLRESRFFRWFSIQGIMTPKRIEIYRNGRMMNLIEFSKIKYNVGIPETFFQKPSRELEEKLKSF